MSEAIEHELSPLGGSEISEASPCGEAVRYEPEFEQLEAELSKLESLKAEPVDWNTVVRLSSEILRSKSKDLLVAVYLCQGLLQTEGYRGLAVGLQIISDMAEKYWDDMFPAKKRLRARKVAMEWLGEKASRYIEASPPSDADAQSVIQAAILSRQLDGDLAEKMENDAPNLIELTRPLKQFREAFKQQQQQQEKAEQAAAPAETQQPSAEQAASAAPEPSAPAPTPSAPPPPPPPAAKAAKSKAPDVAVGSVESEGDVRKSLRQLQDGLRKVAGFLQKSKISDPKTYRLARTATWMTIEQLPPNKDGLTQLPPPPAEKCKAMAAQVDQAQFSAVVPEIEQTLARSAFWFDGQRLVANSLKSMGAEYAGAYEAVTSELRHFLNRMPGVMDLKFADGSPFADDATKMWIDAEVMTASAGGEKSASAGAATPWNDALEEARGLAAGGDLDKAVGQLHVGIAHSGSVREQFYWRTALAELLIQSGNVRVAIQMLEQMIERIEALQLEEWESGLVVPIYRRLLDAYQKSAAASKKKGGDAGLLEKIESVYSRLCWLDPMIAMTVKGD